MLHQEIEGEEALLKRKKTAMKKVEVWKVWHSE